jgi:hypothetical protein
VTSHRAYHRTILGWQETSTPSLAQIGQFLNFLRFFSSKIRIQSDCRDVIDDVIEPSFFFQINFKVARNLHAKFGMNGTVPEFFTIFLSSKRHPKRPW